MFKLFFNYLDDLLIFYVDDIIVYSEMESEHLVHLRKVFKKCGHAGMKLKPSKCDFFKLHIEYLGCLISGTEMFPLEQKDTSYFGLGSPNNIIQVQHILGLAIY